MPSPFYAFKPFSKNLGEILPTHAISVKSNEIHLSVKSSIDLNCFSQPNDVDSFTVLEG